MGEIEDALSRVMPEPRILKLSARTGEGMEAWRAWLETMRGRVPDGRPAEARAHTHGHAHGHTHSHEHEHEHEPE
jgi:urease accessory protein